MHVYAQLTKEERDSHFGIVKYNVRTGKKKKWDVPEWEEPCSWAVARIEVEAETEIGEQILIQFAKKWGNFI